MKTSFSITFQYYLIEYYTSFLTCSQSTSNLFRSFTRIKITDGSTSGTLYKTAKTFFIQTETYLQVQKDQVVQLIPQDPLVLHFLVFLEAQLHPSTKIIM